MPGSKPTSISREEFVAALRRTAAAAVQRAIQISSRKMPGSTPPSISPSNFAAALRAAQPAAQRATPATRKRPRNNNNPPRRINNNMTPTPPPPKRARSSSLPQPPPQPQPPFPVFYRAGNNPNNKLPMRKVHGYEIYRVNPNGSTRLLVTTDDLFRKYNSRTRRPIIINYQLTNQNRHNAPYIAHLARNAFKHIHTERQRIMNNHEASNKEKLRNYKHRHMTNNYRALERSRRTHKNAISKARNLSLMNFLRSSETKNQNIRPNIILVPPTPRNRTRGRPSVTK